MIQMPSCAVCDAQDWGVLGSKTYRRCDIEEIGSYLQQRLRVLFDIWAPKQDYIEIKSILCNNCGFVCYSPRPTKVEMDRKYEYLTSVIDQTQSPNIPSHENRKLRAKDLYSATKTWLPNKTKLNVLDFGGGDGHLMARFVSLGAECSVIDWNNDVVPGVKRIGSTVDDLDSAARFDLIVCSHVVEHLAEPRQLLTKLVQRLSDSGVLYVEVPMEIWKRAPLQEEPVTHINFFTRSSLRTLIKGAGARCHRVWLGQQHHPAGHVDLVVRIVAGLSLDLPDKTAPDGVEEARKYLAPSVWMKIYRKLKLPATIWSSMLRPIDRFLKPRAAR